MARLVLADASPLIGLARVDGLPWLGALFGVVLMSPEVRREVLPNRGHPDERAILAAETTGWLRETGPPPTDPELPDLDEGEAACIRIALANPGPSLSHLAETQGAALEGITGLVTDIVADMQAAGESPPAPIADREYSGRFQVRITPELHRRLAIRAAEANVSLNRIVSDQLAKP
jgi:predicted HicB family RNase H-like nuclease